MLDLRRLRVLRELAARGTVAATAEALSYTPSAVSQQLAQLQAEAGVPLLERVGRGVRLTNAGRALVRHTDELLGRLELAEAELERQTGEVRGTVRLGSFQTAGIALVPPALAELAQRHPALRVEYLEAEAEESLPLVLRGELDLAVAEEYPEAPRRRDRALVIEEIGHDPMLIALPAGHRLARRSRLSVPLAELAGEVWATARSDTLYTRTVVNACRSLGGFEPDVRHRSNDLRVVLGLIAVGQAVALLPGLGDPGAVPGVAVRTAAEGRLGRTVFAAVRRTAAERPAVSAVRAALGRAASALDARLLDT